MHHTRVLSVLLALAASASTLHAEVVPILSDTAGTVTTGATTLTRTGGAAKTLAISPKSTAFIRFATGDTGILPSEVGAARLTIYFAAVTKPGSVSFHNVTGAFTESFPEKSKPAPAFDAAFASGTAVTGQYLTLDVTAQVVTWLATPTPGGFGVAITADGTTAALLASKEGAGSGHPAVLEIDLTSSAVTTGVDLANAATSANTAGTIMRRDGSGNVTVGTITGTLAGNATSATTATTAASATTATTAGSATNFTGSLAGNVVGPQGATVVDSVGGVSAASVASGANLANAATSLNTAFTIMRRDASGNVSAGVVTANIFSGSGAGLTNIPASALATTPAGMALIPAGSFTIGNSIGDADITDAAPIKTTVSAFYMDVNLISLSQWQAVKTYADANGYTFANDGSGKAATHPVQTVNWWDCVKWCNARSQQAGRTPAYYTDAGLTTVYKTGEPVTVYVDWVVSGYRLPTEAEWEKAARGGRSNQRFPRANTISHSQANYFGNADFAYDLSPIDDYHPTYATGGFPYTSPVGSFPANGYGLFDMAGNVFQWCWDWYGTPYAGGSDPSGPASGSTRVIRGGPWSDFANWARCAFRISNDPASAINIVGFRAVLPSGQP